MFGVYEVKMIERFLKRRLMMALKQPLDLLYLGGSIALIGLALYLSLTPQNPMVRKGRIRAGSKGQISTIVRTDGGEKALTFSQ